ncbi:hypothetical protein CEXT_690541 [Caerostris extrusa]|uniref:Uncharacterized protein n=1 Tax=Caerostris extrusa TaxID=172846 RepID=A0AAV4MLE0_CAEEX|nr:hypothetical protein CEXT_690541 [Caerostris extrusa]
MNGFVIWTPRKFSLFAMNNWCDRQTLLPPCQGACVRAIINDGLITLNRLLEPISLQVSEPDAAFWKRQGSSSEEERPSFISQELC